MSGDTQLLLWLTGVHLLGLGCAVILLIPALRSDPEPPKRRSDPDGEDGWGRGPRKPPEPPPGPSSGGIPLLDAEQSRIRLREPGRLSEQLRQRGRRPAREPQRRPSRVPHRSGR
jgi:hypothetical protein